MPRETIIYERDRLYEEVWESPVSKVAKRYGVTDAALRKICRRLGVPVPGNGHWARLSAGKKVTREPLYILKEGAPTTHRVDRFRNPLDEVGPGDEANALLKREEQAEFQIQVEAEPANLHPIVKRYSARLRRSQKKMDRLWREQQCLDINATNEALERAILIANALLLGLNQRGFKVEITKPIIAPGESYPTRRGTTPSKTGVHILGCFVEWGIEEKVDIIKHEPAKPRKQDSSWMFREPVRYERIPNGQLALKIKTSDTSSRRKNWGDGKKQRVEDCVNAFITGLIKTAERKRIEKLDKERKQRERELRRQQQEVERQRHEHEAAMVKDLAERVAAWTHANDIRGFLQAVRNAAQDRGDPADESTELGGWLKWADARADYLQQDAVETVLQTRPRPFSGYFNR